MLSRRFADAFGKFVAVIMDFLVGLRIGLESFSLGKFTKDKGCFAFRKYWGEQLQSNMRRGCAVRAFVSACSSASQKARLTLLKTAVVGCSESSERELRDGRSAASICDLGTCTICLRSSAARWQFRVGHRAAPIADKKSLTGRLLRPWVLVG